MATRTKNSFKIVRRLAGHSVVIDACYVARAELYTLTVKCDGEIWSTHDSDDVLKDAADILSEVFTEVLEGEDFGDLASLMMVGRYAGAGSDGEAPDLGM